jgi:hypothetical protein
MDALVHQQIPGHPEQNKAVQACLEPHIPRRRDRKSPEGRSRQRARGHQVRNYGSLLAGDFRFEPLSGASYISPALDNNEFATRAGPNEISGAHLKTLLIDEKGCKKGTDLCPFAPSLASEKS